MKRDESGSRTRKSVLTFALLTLALMLIGRTASAQTPTAGSKPAEPQADPKTYQTLHLTNVDQVHDAIDIVTDLRNMLPAAKVYYVQSQNAISMLGTPDDFLLAQKILSDMGRPRKLYRITYTITETDSGQRIGTRRVALVVVPGGKADLKQGSRVPIVTGSYDTGRSASNNQVQYLDVGLNIEASLDGPSDDLRLHTKVEQSSVAEEKSEVGAEDPVIRQTSLEGTSALEQGKPLVLGSLDIPGSTRHEEIEASSELIQ